VQPASERELEQIGGTVRARCRVKLSEAFDGTSRHRIYHADVNAEAGNAE